MIKELILHGDEDSLDVTDDLAFVARSLLAGVMFRWNREGLVKDIPRNVVQNALMYYQDRQRVLDTNPSPCRCTIDWSQCQ